MRKICDYLNTMNERNQIENKGDVTNAAAMVILLMELLEYFLLRRLLLIG